MPKEIKVDVPFVHNMKVSTYGGNINVHTTNRRTTHGSHLIKIRTSIDSSPLIRESQYTTNSMKHSPAMEIEVHNIGERAHIRHLYVKTEMRGHGVGSMLIDMFKKYIEKADIPRVSGRIKNGGTKQFLINNGFNEDCMSVVRIEPNVDNVLPFTSVVIGGAGDFNRAKKYTWTQFSKKAYGIKKELLL